MRFSKIAAFVIALPIALLLVSVFSIPVFAADFYEILELPKGKASTPDEIKRAYRRLAMRYHPDRNLGSGKAEEKFKEVQKAYEVLSDSDRRHLYDHGVWDGPLTEVGANGIKTGSPGRRAESTFDDPTGIGGLNNSRINYLHETYVEMRKLKSPADALIATLKKERGIDRPRILLWGRQIGMQIYEAQTQYVFDEFIREIMDDLFYTGENINSPTDRPLLDRSGEQNAVALRPKNEITFSRWPTLNQIMEINKLYGGLGNYVLIERAIKEARSRTDLVELFHYMMKNYLYDLLDYPERLEESITRTRKTIVTQLEPALQRLHPGKKCAGVYFGGYPIAFKQIYSNRPEDDKKSFCDIKKYCHS